MIMKPNLKLNAAAALQAKIVVKLLASNLFAFCK